MPKILDELKFDPADWYRENDLAATHIPDVPPWPHVANILLGLWLIGTAPALGMTAPALRWNDLESGAAIMVFSALAMRHAWAAWTVSSVGLWVMSAPLLFWASNAAVYNNDLLIGALVVTFAVIVPQLGHDAPGSGFPPGWSYNPSGWESCS